MTSHMLEDFEERACFAKAQSFLATRHQGSVHSLMSNYVNRSIGSKGRHDMC